MKKIANILAILATTIPLTANAECVPVPDCASIGYTETSCEGGSLKCPFDTTKLKCIPCDSSFRFTCSGENVKNPIGDTCNNKYAACECIAGATFTNGECICDNSCDTIGNFYYPDGLCSSCILTSQSPIGIIVKANSLIASLDIPRILWSSDYTDIGGIANANTADIAQTDYNGKSNTAAIVAHYGTDADSSTNAGVYCYNYTTAGTNVGEWYLPAAGELFDYIGKNFTEYTSGLNKYGTHMPYIWITSSTETNIPYFAYEMRADTEHPIVTFYKSSQPNSIICFREI